MINAIKRFFGIHIHTFSRWEVARTLKDQYGAVRVIQSQQCSECGFIRFKKTDIL